MSSITKTINLTALETQVKRILSMPNIPNDLIDYDDIPEYVTDLRGLRNKKNQPSTVKVRYIKGYREYFIPEEKKWVPSMTSVLGKLEKYGLEEWQDRFTETQLAEIMLFYQRRGEVSHYQIAEAMVDFFGTEEVKRKAYQDVPEFIYTATEEELALYQSYLLVLARMVKQFFYIYQNRIRLLDIETLCYSKSLGICGRFDLMFKLYEDGRWIPCIGDIKTSKQLYPSVPAQLTGYHIALKEMGLFTAERLYELRFYPEYETPEDMSWEIAILPEDKETLIKAKQDFDLAIELKKQRKG